MSTSSGRAQIWPCVQAAPEAQLISVDQTCQALVMPTRISTMGTEKHLSTDGIINTQPSHEATSQSPGIIVTTI